MAQHKTSIFYLYLLVAISIFMCTFSIGFVRTRQPHIEAIEATASSLTATANQQYYNYKIVSDIDYFAEPSLDRLISSSDLIVIGQIKTTNETVSFSDEIVFSSFPIREMVDVATVYEVSVSSYIKGSGTDTIYFVQTEALFSWNSTPPMPTPDATLLAKARAFQHVSIPKENTPYLLFLAESKQYPKYYVGGQPPWGFDLSNPENILPESDYKQIHDRFPQSLDGFLKKIQQALLTNPLTLTPTSND